MKDLNWPLMSNNITQADVSNLISWLSAMSESPRLTQSSTVKGFEEDWSNWLGVDHSVFVNSGASANFITLAAVRELKGRGEVIVPPLTWVSDIAAVLKNDMVPVFVDIDLKTLGLDASKTLDAITPNTSAIFITHVLGYNAITGELLKGLESTNVDLIEDTCESHGATFGGQKLGSIGWISNFSFYYAHHMSTIEGGMVSTNDDQIYDMIRMLRSHGMVRESVSEYTKQAYGEIYKDLNPAFIFAYPGYNFRSTEINAFMGSEQLKRLDANNIVRNENLNIFLTNLNPTKFYTEFSTDGCSNYALTLLLREPNDDFRDKVQKLMDDCGVEYRRGMSGGGNQLRQPYLKKLYGELYKQYPNTNHVHFYGYYIGNYPTLNKSKIIDLCNDLNSL